MNSKLTKLAALAAVAEGTRVNTQANVQEVAQLIQEALSKSGEKTELNTNIGNTIQAAIKTEQKQDQQESSKLGFLQKVVSLDCFFGSSNCLFKDKKALMAGEITNLAQIKMEQANVNTTAALAQIKTEVAASTTKALSSKEAELNKQLHDSVAGLMKLNEKKDTKAAPPANKVMQGNNNLVSQGVAARTSVVKVPIDEVKAIGVKLEPTYDLDDVQSVTLKSFRKVIGYDTFNSILKKDRDEVKDPADYYNVTVSMMIKRSPHPSSQVPAEKWKNAEGKTLSQVIDKGFPYDDGDNDVLDRIKKATKKNSVGEFVGKLNGMNVSKDHLKNLVVDKAQPLTESNFVLLDDDKDNVFKLMDSNVTKGQMKNLLTDKPSPITVKLAQKDSENLFKLMDANVTKGQMKNLLTDKPAPITVKLAQQMGDRDNVFKLMDANVTKGQMKNLITDKPSPITTKLAQMPEEINNVQLAAQNPYNWYQAPAAYQLVQMNQQNPVANPPFNNWSVNQPSVPHASGLNGFANLGQHIIVDGHQVDFLQTSQQNLLQTSEIDNEPGHFDVVDKDQRDSLE